MCKADSALAQPQGEPAAPESAEVFVGAVKSYNGRRGFGFLSCEETARRFDGRDVYLSKVEVAALGQVVEGDLVGFAVQLSAEGFPQAVRTTRVAPQGAAAAPAPAPEGVAAAPAPEDAPAAAPLPALEAEPDRRSWATISEEATEPETPASPAAPAAGGQRRAKRKGSKAALAAEAKAFRWAPSDELVSSVSYVPEDGAAADLCCGPCAAPEPTAPLILATSPSAAAAARAVPEAPFAEGPFQAGGWRCVHGGLVPPTLAPELEPTVGTDGMSLCIRWPSVVHAAAYRLQVQQLGDGQCEGFSCVVPVGQPASLVELCLQGLTCGKAYAASVCCVAPCGCESASSEWACLVPQPAPEPAAAAPDLAPAMALGLAEPPRPAADTELCERLLLA